MSSIENKKQRLSQLFGLRLSELNERISILQTVIINATEDVLLEYLSKTNLNIERAINLYFANTPSSINNVMTINKNVNNITLSPSQNIQNRKRKRNIDNNIDIDIDNEYEPLNKRRKLQINDSNDNHNHNHNTNSSMKEERECDDKDEENENEDDDIKSINNMEEKYDPNWSKKILGTLKMEYSVNRRCTILSIHHLPQASLRNDIKINKYCPINTYMTNKNKLTVYYKQCLDELRIPPPNIKVTLKQKKLISGRSEDEINAEYKKNKNEEKHERKRLFQHFKMIHNYTDEQLAENFVFRQFINKEVDGYLKKRKKPNKPFVGGTYLIEFEVALIRKKNDIKKPESYSNDECILYSKLNIPFTIGLVCNNKELSNNINEILCIRNRYKSEGHRYSLIGLLDFSCRYSYNYKSNKINRDNLNDGLSVKLHEYQFQSLDWMMNEENDEIGFYRHFYSKGSFNDNTCFFYSVIFEDLIINGSLPIAHGGFLCEEMGLGKTIISLALINCNKPKDLNRYSTRNKLKIIYNGNNKYYKSKGTLIIAPVSLVGQWEKECDNKSKQKIKYKRYYGSRSRNIADYIDQDIVFTTYGIIANETGNNQKIDVLHQIEWHRIILDESHYILNGGNVTSRNINNLYGINKWCLTGTPFGRQIKDIENQLKFIGIKQNHLNRLDLSKINRLNLFNGCGNFNNSRICIGLMMIMKKLMMRHKKSQKFNGKEIVSLPEKVENVIFIDFTVKQRKYYNILYETAKQRYNYYKTMGNIGRGQIDILSSLFPARQACSGYIYNVENIKNELNKAEAKTFQIQLLMNKNKNKSRKEIYNMAQQKAYNNDENGGECPICYECPFDAPLQTPCRHIFCGECITSILAENNECPLCRKNVEIKQLQKPPPKEKKNEEEKIVNNNDDDDEEEDDDVVIKFDSKLKRLIKELKEIKRNKPNEKSLIFTSFSKSLDRICNELNRNGLSYRTLTGSMSMNKRKKELDEFSNNLNVKIFVLTVRSGAVGITLTAANHVFILEPPFNAALYRQAINRVYRLGQKKKVFIHTLIMKDSIEEKIWNINKLKQNGINNKNIAGNITADNNVKLQQYEVSRLFE